VKEFKLDSDGLGEGPVVGLCEHNNKTSAFIRAGNFLTS